MKKIFILLLLTVLVFVSCKKNITQTQITFWHAMGGPLGKTLEAMVADFEKANPDVKVILIGMGDYSALAQKLMGAISVDNPPTIAQVYESWTTQFYEQNQLFALDSFIHSPNGLTQEELDDMFAVFAENNKWGGKFLTFPFNKSVPVYFYNIAMFDSLGIKEFPQTWQDFRLVCKRLTQDVNQDGKIDIWGTGGSVNSWLFGSMLYQKDGRLLDEANRKVTFNTKTGADILQYMIDLIYIDSVSNFVTGYEPQNDFLSGKLGLIWGTIVSWAFMKDKMTFPIGIAPIPTWDKNAVLSYGTNICLFKKATDKQKQAGWRFIKWFTQPKQQAQWAKGTFYVPVCRATLEQAEYAQVLEETKGLREAIAQLDYAYFEPRGEEWFAGRKYLGEAIEEAMRLKTAPQKALDNAAIKLEKEWKEQTRKNINKSESNFYVNSNGVLEPNKSMFWVLQLEQGSIIGELYGYNDILSIKLVQSTNKEIIPYRIHYMKDALLRVQWDIQSSGQYLIYVDNTSDITKTDYIIKVWRGKWIQ